MKKLILAAIVLVNVQAIDYTHVKCATQAQEACKELTNKEDFYSCYYTSLEWCLADSQDQINKSVPACFQQCAFIAEEAHRELCYQTCTER